MTTWYLVGGLGLLFLGLATVILMAGIIGKERSQVSASMAAIESISGPVPADMRAKYDQPFNARVTQPVQAWLANAARTVAGGNWAKNTTKRLDMAGNPARWDAERILAAKAVVAVVFGGLAVLFLWATGRGWSALLWGIVFAVAGFFLPDLLLINTAQNRAESISKALPNTIDLLTVSVESGLAFDAALANVAQNTEGPLSDEFRRVLREIQIGSSRSAALRALAERTTVDDLRIFLNSMIQAEKLGIPIADVLRVQASEMRLKKSQRTEEQAMKLPVKLVFPLLLCIMPLLFIVIIGPAAINISQNLFI
ncbi:MAG: type II secretion system F family protein [Candidatus Nanopelagicales bacterium]